MSNPLNWLKAILIIGACTYNTCLLGKSTLDDEFISIDIERNYLPHYFVSGLITAGIVVGTCLSIYISINENGSFVGLVYLILGI